MANHKDKTIIFDGKPLVVKRGQRITSIRELSQRWGWYTKKTIEFLKLLETLQMITKESDKRKTLLTVVKYDVFQLEGNSIYNSNDNSLYNSSDNSSDIQTRMIRNNYKEILPKGNIKKGCQMDMMGNDVLSDKQKAQLADNMTPITLEVVTYLNEKANTNFKPCTDKTKRCIKARVNEGFTLEDFKKVIDKKVNSWMGTEWQKYLRPETLFGTKFEGYLNETDVKPRGNSFNQMIHTDYDFDEIEKQILK